MPNPGAPDVSLVIPAYHEAQRLEASFAALQAYLSRVEWTHEVIVVVEKSSDGTLELARRLAEGQAAFRIIGNPEQRGKGFAVRTGMQAARGEIRFFMDADLSTPLEEIDHFLAAFAREPEVQILIGSRQHPQSRIVRRQSWLRQRMGETFNRVLRSLTHLPFHDTQCGFKAFRRAAGEAVFARQALDGFAFDVEVLLLAQSLGIPVKEMPVEWRNAPGSKVHMIRDSWRMLRDALRVRHLSRK